MTSNMSLCDMYQDESFNRKPQFHCRQKFPTGEPKGYSEYNTQEKCEQLDDNGGACVCVCVHVGGGVG